MGEEEAIDKGIPEDKNRKIPSETISGQNQSQRLVYKYDESDMGPFRVLIRPAGSDPKNNTSVVDIGRMLGKLDINYRRISRTSDEAGQCPSARTTWQTVW
jgi:hypothetical protein